MNTEVKDRKRFWHTVQLDMDANLRPKLPAGVIGPFVNSSFSDVTAMIIAVSSPNRSYAEGGGQNLRGFQRQRFYGKTAFYNSNELRFISNVKSYLYNGKAGLFAFVDDGRVWMPGETSNTLHVGYGGGIFLAPFNLVSAEVTYGFSREDNLLQFRFNVKL
jgi:outer membrane translocation and assembly module TamA